MCASHDYSGWSQRVEQPYSKEHGPTRALCFYDVQEMPLACALALGSAFGPKIYTDFIQIKAVQPPAPPMQ